MEFHSSTLPVHSPPGNLDDLTPENRKLWSDLKISKWMEDEINATGENAEGPCGQPRTKLSQFFDGTITPFEAGQDGATVTWTAFPGIIQRKYAGNDELRWAIADYSRMVQDEYCEWSVARDQDNKIQSVTFTCEGPEYWQFIADYQDGVDGKTITDLYNKLMPGNDIEKKDLYIKDEKTGETVYNPLNFFNITSTTGYIAHLTHPANSLSAEVDIAAQATVRRIDKDGHPITDSSKLINCSKYGQPLRNSDPSIGSAINNLANGGNAISLKDPVALYMNSWDPSIKNVTLDEVPITQIPGLITFTRGQMPEGLRFTIQIPEGYKSPDGTPRTVSDIWDDNTSQSISYGAQFTDYLNMSVSAVVIGNYPLGGLERCPCEVAKEKKAADDGKNLHKIVKGTPPRGPGPIKPGFRKHRYQI
ncbi:hypothetical protein TWF730_009187 [Orbilia blumenaviensis]|uniref:Uncharacterized protein n=1 Tax=Orbilia blumenaviensis TaxID=1796055 RepID=A0AAV9UZ14_9PEZI